MGPIEIVFLAIILLFGAIGIVRGIGRELGVLTVLLAALAIVEYVDTVQGTRLKNLIGSLVGAGVTRQVELQSLLYCAFLILVTFVAYEGETLTFTVKGQSQVYGAICGLINGWLFAGSVWFYLHRASWLSLSVIDTTKFSDFYNLAIQFLPPAIFTWTMLIGLAAFLLLLRVWK